MPDLPELESIILEAKEWVSMPNNDFSWSSWIDADHALAELEAILGRIQRGELPVGADILFLPTGPMQELALSSGWGDEFIELATRFDLAYR